MKNIDLHIHSTYSDGTYTPIEILDFAKEKNLSAIALTDHDTIDGLAKAREYAKAIAITFINGIEINSYCYVREHRVNIHVLGYLFQEEKIRKYTEQLKAFRFEHNKAMLEALQKIGIKLDYEAMREKAGNGTITRLNFAHALVEEKYTSNVEEALATYLHKGGAAYVEYKNDAFPIVAKQIHDAGGIVSLAHPAEYNLNEEDTNELILSCVEHGLDAIECIHPSQDAIWMQKLEAIAKENHLKRTGGSDFHGNHTPDVKLGFGRDGMRIPICYLDNLNV